MVLSAFIHHTWRLCRVAAAAALLIALGATTASAQWEWIYGIGGTNEGGRRGVRPVGADACHNLPGYISVGWSNVSGNDDVYVVRTDCNGARVFETTIDITGGGVADRGRAIAPTFNSAGLIDGYVITGWTQVNVQDVFIAKIDCNGVLIWARTYGQTNFPEGGHDIIVTRFGNPNGTPKTHCGDIVVAGWAMEPQAGNPPRMTDGYLLRTNAGGVLLTDAAFDNATLPAPPNPPTDEIFMALTELSTGNIMAVGSTTANNGPHAWALRVTPLLTPFPGLGATYGPQGSSFFSVIELQNPAETGPLGLQNVVAVGDNGGGTDMLAVKMPDGDPRCQATTLEANIGLPNDMEVAYDVKEIDFTPNNPTLPQWSLVMTGWHDDPNTPADPREAHIITTTPAFVPIFGNVYNANVVGGVEEGWSVHVDNTACAQSLIMCGTTSAYDPGDLYLVRTNMFGKSNCETPYNPTRNLQNFCQNLRPRRVQILKQVLRCPTEVSRNLGRKVCPIPVPVPTDASITTSPDLSDNSQPSGYDAASAMSLVPNGTPLSVSTRKEQPVSMTVSNSLGKVIATYPSVEANEEGVIVVPTTGLLPGTYSATFDDGQDVQKMPFVVD